jgi:hypothetical protein
MFSLQLRLDAVAAALVRGVDHVGAEDQHGQGVQRQDQVHHVAAAVLGRTLAYSHLFLRLIW